jgi:hypothetical protein
MYLKITIILLLIYGNLFGQNILNKVDLDENYTWQNHSEEEINKYYLGLEPYVIKKFFLHMFYTYTT